MRLFSTLLLLMAVGASPAFSQQLDLSDRSFQLQSSDKRSTENGVQRAHITHLLLESEEGRAALKQFHADRAAGKMPSGNVAASFTPGSVKTFRVRNIAAQPSLQWDEIEFTLMAQESLFNIWVESEELTTNGGFVTQADLTEMIGALADETPAGSYRPDHGIIENDELVFGNPPNRDGDGKTDVLLVDIRDGFSGQGSAVVGFFDPADLSGSNNADIVYIDTVPGMYTLSGSRKPLEDVQQTLAHEYQHLIFASYNSGDLTFVNEGLSEWAEVMNGYTARPVTYLGLEAELSLPFMTVWRDFGGPEARDYQRAGLFTTYISERIGTAEMWRIVQSGGTGHGNYVTTFNNLSLPPDFLQTVMAGFHTANAVNDISVAPDYGYTTPQYASVRASNIQTFDGTQSNSRSLSGTLNVGSVSYKRFNTVGDFSVNVQAGGGSVAEQSRMRPHLYAKPAGQPGQVHEVTYNSEIGLHLEGNFEYVILILPHVDLATSQSLSYSVTTSWQDFDSSVSYTSIAYENGEALRDQDGGYFGVPLRGEGFVDSKFSNRFEIPANGRLSSVSVGVFYMDQFNESDSNVRDFRLAVWDDDESLPGNIIMELDVTDSSSDDPPTIGFQQVDLSSYQSQLGQLSGTLYVSIANTGTDDNYIFVPDVQTDEEPLPSYMYYPFVGGTFSWAPYDEISSGGEPRFEGLAVPIRATFVTGTDNEEPHFTELPQAIELGQNYPNPFNPSTSISYTLPQSADVQLTVLDLLGRQVAVLQSGPQAAGTHQVTFDASRLASGMYLYSLKAGSERLSRTMMLIK